MTSPQPAVFDGASLIRDTAGAGEWPLERQSSRVEFAVKHFWGLMTVRGGFAGLDGAAQVNTERISDRIAEHRRRLGRHQTETAR